MDSSIAAAGSRPVRQTFDQAPNVRQHQQWQSDIFGVSSGPVVQTPQRQSQRPKTDIFGVDQSASLAQSRVDTRQTKTYQSNIFNADPSANNTHTAKETVTTQHKGKNNQARHQDHGKDFLFGKSDFDEYKSMKRATTLREFKPKEDYDPTNRRQKELYGNEIGREHLPTPTVKLEENKQAVKKQQQQLDPQARKQLENESNLFGQGEKKVTKTQPPAEKLTSQTAKWNTTSKATNNSGKDYDPDTFAKNKKEKELQSSVFGEDNKKQVQNTGPKQKLIPTQQNWQTTDTVKNMKDFDPSQSQINEVDPQQKKMDTLKSAMDTHDYKGQQVKHSEKLSVKQQKYKADVFTRGGEKNNEKQQQVKQQPKVQEQSDMI